MLRSYRKLVLQKMYDGLNFNHKEENSLLLVIREHSCRITVVAVYLSS